MKSLLPGVLAVPLWCFALTVQAEEPKNIPVGQLGKAYQLVGKLHTPLGEPVHVEGVVVEGPSKGNEDGPNLRVLRIQGQATQEDIRIQLHPYFMDWGHGEGEDTGDDAGNDAKTDPEHGVFSADLPRIPSLPKLENGKTYDMEGYETGGYVGIPSKAFSAAGIMLQCSGHYFRTQFVVYRAKRIEPLSFGPGDYRGRRALLQGTARTRGGQSFLDGEGWRVLVAYDQAWPTHVEGKLIETDGLYNPDASTHEPLVPDKQFILVDGTWRLVFLEDQVGQSVALRGTARNVNGVWWFTYRGTELYIDKLTELPGWTSHNYARPVLIRGRLEKAALPRLDQLSEKAARDLKEYYIVRDASWEPLSEPLLRVELPIDGRE